MSPRAAAETRRPRWEGWPAQREPEGGSSGGPGGGLLPEGRADAGRRPGSSRSAVTAGFLQEGLPAAALRALAHGPGSPWWPHVITTEWRDFSTHLTPRVSGKTQVY